MKTFLSLLSVLAAASLYLLRLADRHPPPRLPDSGMSTYAAVSEGLHASSGCELDPNFEPVDHTAQQTVEDIFFTIATAAGKDPTSFSIEMMQDRRGIRTINAMTCADSRVIWLSVTAWEQLNGYESAIALMLAHELAHADHRAPSTLEHDPMTAAERNLLSGLTTHQKVEVAADQRAADLMITAGYSLQQINNASRFIQSRQDSGMNTKATATHPGGRDRTNLMTFYLGRKLSAQFSR